MNVHDVPLLRCPDSGAPLRFHGTNLEALLQDGVLVCDQTDEAWAVERGIPNLTRLGWHIGSDAAAASMQDAAPALLDPIAAVSSLMLGSGRVAGQHDRVAKALRLGPLARLGRPIRVLELNVGTGSRIEPAFDQAPGADVQWFGCSMSIGALRAAEARVARHRGWAERVSLLMADPHHLPFADGIFDRVLMVGAVDCLREPPAALRELARVCRGDGEVLLIDKHVTPERAVSPLARLTAAALGRARSQPQAPPTGQLPPGCRKVEVEDFGPAQYLLRFAPPRA